MHAQSGARGGRSGHEASRRPGHEGSRSACSGPHREPGMFDQEGSARHDGAEGDDMTSPDPIIEVRAVAKEFGDVTALDGVDLDVEDASVVGLLGPNGAGKTTLVRILATLLPPDRGSVRIGGHNVVAEPDAVRALIGLAGQSAAVDGLLTGRENVEMIGRLYGLDRRQARDRAHAVLDTLGLAGAADRLVRGYSGGMRRRLDLGASLVGKPRVLILDEPTTGLDPRTRIDLWDLLANFVREGTAVLLTTQYLEEADRLADRIVVVDRGQVIADGTADALKNRCGTDVIDLRLRRPEQAEPARQALAPLAADAPHWDPDNQRITVRSADGAGMLLEALRRLDAAGIDLEDIAVRRPTLDDVFLALTGRATIGAASEAQPGRRRRRGRAAP
jgi:ABC-2 type transport system ATP-binding protein